MKITQKSGHPWPALFGAIIDSILNPSLKVIFSPVHVHTVICVEWTFHDINAFFARG